MAKRASTVEKRNLLTKLNWLERKNKFNKSWDSQVKTMFQSTGSFSFEEMIIKDKDAAQQLVVMFE